VIPQCLSFPRFLLGADKPASRMSLETIFAPPELPLGTSYTLAEAIPVLRVDNKAGQSYGSAKLGPMLQLPAGSHVELCGAGFNSRTVKVRHNDSYYFAFQEDLAKSASSITIKQRVAERIAWQEGLLNQYAQVVRFYQSAVLQLKEAGDAGDFSAFEDLLSKVHAAREALERWRSYHQHYCRE